MSFEGFCARLEKLRERIGRACRDSGRIEDSVRILPVTKYAPIEALGYCHRAGFAYVGESRVQSLIEKSSLQARPEFELIGHLQTNKVRKAVALCQRIQSVDSIGLAQKISQSLAEGHSMRILLQVNTAKDPAKHGFLPEEAIDAIKEVLKLPGVHLEGLMCMAAKGDDATKTREAFGSLRILRDEAQVRFGVKLPELSMGMSGDLEAAIAEGSTLIRVGSALFGD